MEFEDALKSLEYGLLQPGGGRIVQYREMQVIIPINHLKAAVADLTNRPNRESVMKSVNRCLKQYYPKMIKQKASQKRAMEYGQDVCIWFANEIIEGRATLEETKQ